jgi:hypothetical protein
MHVDRNGDVRGEKRGGRLMQERNSGPIPDD